MPYDSLFAVVVMAAVVVIVAAGILSKVNKRKKKEKEEKEEKEKQASNGPDSDIYYDNADPDVTAAKGDFGGDGGGDD